MFTKSQNSFLTTLKSANLLVVLCLILINQNQLKAQVGPLIWEDNFNSLNAEIWQPDIGDGCDIGLCGWGNQELQYYQSENVSIENIPGDPGNSALVLEARNENAGTRAFTSGKVTTKGNLAIHYGLIEVRVQVPDLQQGLWPAAWLLGTANLTWPANGEIDIMEMGFSQEGRNQQEEPNSTTNNYVGANAFFPVPGGVGNIAYDVDYNTPYVASTPLTNRFVTYRIYWEPTQIRFTVVDNGNEYDLYADPFPIDPDGVTSVFTRPFYMLLNLAVGGTLPGTLTNESVTAPLPGKMLVDYVRVYEWNGHGSVEFNYDELIAESGVFGVYTDETPTNNELVFGSDAEIYAWGETVSEGTEAPYEGENVIAWETNNANSWFGGGIAAINGKDMSNYVENGSLKFNIKIPGNVAFRIGITDNFTNEKFIEFPAGQNQYGLTRNGEWGQVEIPFSEFEGLLAFQNINYMFAIGSVDGALPTSTFQFAIDNIIWDDGNTANPPVLSSISITPENVSISNGATQQFEASSLDQFGNPITAQLNWSATGGNINQDGLFTATSAGNFTVTASANGINENVAITVTEVSNAIQIPGIVEAEDYDEGGQNIGYFDTTTGNIGGAYRDDDVDIEITSDGTGTYNVGWIEAGEWLQYSINAQAESEMYDFTFRVASPNGNGQFYLEVDGNPVTDILNVPNTGAWQSYVDVTVSDIAINQGQHTLRLQFVNAGLNINYMEAEATVTNNTGCSQLSANGDFSVEFSEDNNNPTLTFIPERDGVGSTTTILYYNTDENAVFPGYGVSANDPFQINANEGETVYYYYTYSLPEGGENNTAANKQSFVVGNCNSNAARTTILSADDPLGHMVKVYPNPAKDYINIQLEDATLFDSIKMYSVQGKTLVEKATKGKESIRLNTNSLPAGLYFIELSGKNGRHTMKIIK